MSVFIIAEAGVNHNGSVSLAKQLIDVAVESGVDAVKFQTFKTENLVLKNTQKAEYKKKTTDAAGGPEKSVQGFCSSIKEGAPKISNIESNQNWILKSAKLRLTCIFFSKMITFSLRFESLNHWFKENHINLHHCLNIKVPRT